MPRPVTVLCAGICLFSGFFLYNKKHDTMVLDRQITDIVAKTRKTQNETNQLRAEYALLNEPDRLHHLQQRFLKDLNPMTPDQYIRARDLPNLLPPVGDRLVIPSHTAQVVNALTEKKIISSLSAHTSGH